MIKDLITQKDIEEINERFDRLGKITDEERRILLEYNNNLEINYNIKPLSVNEAWQGKRFKTQVYKNYETELLFALPNKKIPKPPYKITFEFGFSNKAADWDNPIKPLQDILQKKYNFNDKEVFKAELTKKIVKKGDEYFYVKIESLNL